MLNSVAIIGRITNDIELRKTKTDVSVTSFTIATEIGHGDNQKTFFIPVICWYGLADVVCQNCGKGSLISVSGYLSSRDYETKDGSRRTAVEIIARDVQFLAVRKRVQVSYDEEEMSPPF